jgi:RNA polymerase sigma-70 factor, ECF subfamily
MTTPDKLPTLGDVLFTGDTSELVSEAQWVALLQSVAARNERALLELFNKTQGVVFGFISCVVNDRDIAESLTVEVFHEVWRHAASFDPALGSVLGWIMRQARSKAAESLRSSQNYATLAEPEKSVRR